MLASVGSQQLAQVVTPDWASSSLCLGTNDKEMPALLGGCRVATLEIRNTLLCDLTSPVRGQALLLGMPQAVASCAVACPHPVLALGSYWTEMFQPEPSTP